MNQEAGSLNRRTFRPYGPLRVPCGWPSSRVYYRPLAPGMPERKINVMKTSQRARLCLVIAALLPLACFVAGWAVASDPAASPSAGESLERPGQPRVEGRLTFQAGTGLTFIPSGGKGQTSDSLVLEPGAVVSRGAGAGGHDHSTPFSRLDRPVRADFGADSWRGRPGRDPAGSLADRAGSGVSPGRSGDPPAAR